MRKGNLYYRFNYTLQGLRERATNATSSWQCGCNKDKQGGGGRARKGQPTEPRTSFASPIFIGVVVAVGESWADAVKGIGWLFGIRDGY